jgi:RNA polymerase sigma factor (sigma-70 family)
MHDDLTALVTRARNGDQQAWDELVDRYAPLIWSICRRYRLGRADAEDVGQSVWLRLAGQLASLRDPAALPGWLATTTQRECGRVLRAARNQETPGHPLEIPDMLTGAAESELLTAERHAALREAFIHLPPGSRQLIALLIQDPPVPYAEISARLGIPVGSIGPSRSRCLEKLRRYPAIAALINAEARNAGVELDIQPGRPVSRPTAPAVAGPVPVGPGSAAHLTGAQGLVREPSPEGPRLLKDGLPVHLHRP